MTWRNCSRSTSTISTVSVTKPKRLQQVLMQRTRVGHCAILDPAFHTVDRTMRLSTLLTMTSQFIYCLSLSDAMLSCGSLRHCHPTLRQSTLPARLPRCDGQQASGTSHRDRRQVSRGASAS
jgi:hypothetical protein